MKRHVLWRVTQLMVVLAALAWGVPVQAGPGGGTYYANSPAGGASGTALRKFVDSLPGLGAANKNNLGQYIPVAIPDTTTYPGSDYYEIGLKEYTQQMHSDLPKATRLRGYTQLNSTDPTVQNVNQYLGPLIIARRYDPTLPAGVNGNGKPVRIKFRNLLPTGAAGNLFLPVDPSLMGAGKGPKGDFAAQFGGVVPAFHNYSGNYTQNRATLHLHGGNSPWISDGTPHQWTVPVGELSTPYQKGASAEDVPDMPPTGQGELTFFWSNEQSGRFMFYHDHSYGITRLNVYAGEAAGYLITDPAEDTLINNGTLPNLGGVYRYGIPLVIQDKTFVPQNIDVQDAAWNYQLTSLGGPAYAQTKVLRNKTQQPWGAYGDLWFPHVYEANQDPNSPDGANPFGRWDYGPWFWPPVTIDPANAKLPDPSTTPEAFMDTPVVNGTAYPYLVVQPKPYRFRILNAANDRTLNLSIFYADPADPTGKEVKMVPAGPNPTFPPDWPTDGRDGGVPDPATVGPNMIQIGNEAGFLRNPVVIPNRPIGYEYNRRNIVVLNTSLRSLMLGPAERADVVVDFSQVPPGSKLILYNDGPAPNPAFDSRYDYYTGNLDQTLGGGAPSTLRGYGPNTRTVMQFQVSGTPGTPFDLAKLKAALPAVFDSSQPAPLVPETWNGAPTDTYAKIQDYSLTIPVNDPVANPAPQAALPKTIPFNPKAIQELWDPWGRMNATLGVELPFTNNLIQTTIPLGYVDTATEIFSDGKEIMWKITHNGVDTHPVHFHLFDLQLLNRVGWDGAIRPPDDNELGWKETIRMNPLEDVIVAMRPKKQVLPFALPNSVRPIDVTQPTTANITVTTDPARGGGTSTVANAPVNYGFEYVWHCHILGHEENDFMRSMIFLVPTAVPPAPTGLTAYIGGQTVPGDPGAPTAINPYVNGAVNQVVLQWADGAPLPTSTTPTDPSQFMVEHSTDGGTTWTKDSLVSFIPEYPPIWTDTSVNPNTNYLYRVTAYNSFNNGSFSAPVVALSVKTGNWTKATGLTISPSKPTPHVVGTLVQFTAAGSGATSGVAGTTVAYEYRFWLSTNGGANVMVRDWGTDPNWALPASAAVGNYVITVDARTTASATPDITQTLNYSIVVPPTPPTTVSSPPPGIYAASPVVVTLTATSVAPPTTTYYTLDGTIPTTASPQYTAPLSLTTTTTVNYFSVDANGTAEAVKSDTWVIHSPDLTASVLINNGATATNTTAVNLTLSAFDPAGVATMQFSNDGVTYTAEEPFLSTKAWTLSAGAGVKTVYVRFRDKALPTGVLYPPVTASITLDSVIPATTATPAPGIYATAPVFVTLTPNKAATVYYTVDGSTPTTASPVYIAPVSVASTTTIKYFAVDAAGNTEAVNTGTWTIHALDMQGSVLINNGATVTNNQSVILALSATDPTGIATMQFSNDGVNFSAEEAYATTKNWTLTAGDGMKTVYVRFRDKALPSGFLYNPVTATIKVDTVAPVTTASPVAGTYGSGPLQITLSTSKPATTYYTVDGTVPTTSSPIYTGPIMLSATTTIKYFSVDAAGNVEQINTNSWVIHTADLTGSVVINNGATQTNNTTVNLTLNATDPVGIATMQVSNDGSNYTAEEPYATSKSWVIPAGDGVKTVYVRFRDKSLPSGVLYPPVTSSINLVTTPPVTTAQPIPGDYSTAPVVVTLTSNKQSTIYYTIDGSTPTTASAVYLAPISVSATTTIKYFGVDTAGNAETVNSGTWSIHQADLTGAISVNGGATRTNNTAVILSLSAVDPIGVATMSFSNDNVIYSAEEPYAVVKNWNLVPGDGPKTVYVRFRDKALPTGVLYPPVAAQITLDTVSPVTSVTPIPGNYSQAPVTVTMTTDKPATIYYTIDGTTPTTASAAYSTPIALASTTNLKYFAVDVAGNQEAVKSGTWTIHSADMISSVSINGGAKVTNNNTVNLTLSAVDPIGVASMQFSNDGVNYSTEEPYATAKVWALTPGDGVKTVYVRFRDLSLPSGVLYDPVTAVIAVDTVPPVTTTNPVPGPYSSTAVQVALSSNKLSTIYYTLDGTIPTTSSSVYARPITLTQTTTVNFFGVDAAGNTEAVKSATYVLHGTDLTASVIINNAQAVTNNPNVTLSLSAIDPVGIATMQFSNDGVNFTVEEPYATSKAWTLGTGDGPKTVYVRFRDQTLPNGQLYDPVTATITLDTTPPVTTAGPITGTYSTVPVLVTLSANEPATTYYTLDGSTPTTSSTLYNQPISLADTTTIKYFSVDTAGNPESVKSGTWTVHATDLVASMAINDGKPRTNSTAVALTISATDPVGIATMAFSNDGVNYTAEEPYAITKAWTLLSGDGPKTVYVRFRDKSLPTGNLYAPVTASIVLDTVAPVTTAGPVAGEYAAGPINVTLTTNKPATVYYTLDGSLPTAASAVYNNPLVVTATTTIRYFAVDVAGNAEPVNTGTWTLDTAPDMVSSIKINNGAQVTNSPTVNLTLSATDPQGVSTMQFSNDGVVYSAEEPYATSKVWTLSAGEGTKTVYVRFRDGSLGGGSQYAPVIASITYGAKDGLLPGTSSYLQSAMKALQIANGIQTATPLDLAHGDVAPFANGAPSPDGKIDVGDVYVLLLRQVGLLPL
ncbi:hypothetical protein GMSM_41850 [Geomonas sp. Red276]